MLGVVVAVAAMVVIVVVVVVVVIVTILVLVATTITTSDAAFVVVICGVHQVCERDAEGVVERRRERRLDRTVRRLRERVVPLNPRGILHVDLQMQLPRPGIHRRPQFSGL